MIMVDYTASLIGKTKNEIFKELGDQFNFFPSNTWIYHLHTNWIGIKTYLIISFDNDIVIKYVKRKTHRKLD